MALLFDLRQVGRTLADADVVLVALGITLGFASWAWNTMKWSVLIRAATIPPRFSYLYRLNLVASLYGTILPGQIAGEAVKVYRIARSSSDRAFLVATVFADRVTGLVGLLVLGSIAAVVAAAPAIVSALLVGALVATSIVGWLSFRVTASASTNEAGPAIRLIRMVRRVLARLSVLLEQRRRLFASVLMSIAFQLILTINVVVFAAALDIAIGIWTMAWVMAIVAIVQLLPITVASIGTRETSFVVLLATQGISESQALALSMMVLLGNLALATAGAVVEFVGRNEASPSSASISVQS